MGKKRIVILIDYKGFFGSKQFSKLYRGGMDVDKLITYFQNAGYDTEAIHINKIQNSYIGEDTVVLFTSSEDKYGLYKSFIEDIIYHLEKQGVDLIPGFEYLKAHNNKVAMELLRERTKCDSIKTIKSYVFGTLEELRNHLDYFSSFPVVLKSYTGAMSRGVAFANNKQQLLKIAKSFSRSKDLGQDLKELLRKLKYKGLYIRESFYRNKFVVQNFIPELKNDWKVLVYGNKCFVLFRKNRKKDFRASGSGYFEFRKDLPQGMLNYALKIRKLFNVPNISLDVGFDGKLFHLIEFQFLYFGTTTIEKSNFYFEKVNGEWLYIEKKADLEKTYADSIITYLKDR